MTTANGREVLAGVRVQHGRLSENGEPADALRIGSGKGSLAP